jgi:putative flippase GtrA
MSEISGAVRRSEAQALPALRRVAGLAPRGLARFLVVGVGGLSVDIAVLWLAERAGIGHIVARIISLSVATLATWALNRHFTFGDSGRRAGAEFGRYALVALVAQSVNFAVFVALCAIWPAIVHSFAAVAGAVVATAFSYTGQRFFTFAPQEAARG